MSKQRVAKRCNEQQKCCYSIIGEGKTAFSNKKARPLGSHQKDGLKKPESIKLVALYPSFSWVYPHQLRAR